MMQANKKMKSERSKDDARYSKAIDVWYYLNKVEQMVINDSDYPLFAEQLSNLMTKVEMLQNKLEKTF